MVKKDSFYYRVTKPARIVEKAMYLKLMKEGILKISEAQKEHCDKKYRVKDDNTDKQV